MMKTRCDQMMWRRVFANRWTPLVVVSLAVAWAGYRMHAVRESAAEILSAAQELDRVRRSLQGKVDAYEAAFLLRPTADLGPVFLQGSERVSKTARLNQIWREPTDGVHLVVDRSCPRSEEAVVTALNIARAGKREAILLDPAPNSGPEWFTRFDDATRQDLRIVTAERGWWSIGLPQGVTPVWLAVEAGRFVGVGVGKNDPSTFAFAPTSPRGVSFSDSAQYPDSQSQEE